MRRLSASRMACQAGIDPGGEGWGATLNSGDFTGGRLWVECEPSKISNPAIEKEASNMAGSQEYDDQETTCVCTRRCCPCTPQAATSDCEIAAGINRYGPDLVMARAKPRVPFALGRRAHAENFKGAPLRHLLHNGALCIDSAGGEAVLAGLGLLAAACG